MNLNRIVRAMPQLFGRIHLGMTGHYRLITRSARYGTRVRAEFDNLILDQGLDRVAQGSWIDYCQVGSGSTAPANGQSALVARIAGTNTLGVADADSYVVGPPAYRQLIRTYRFATGVAAGTLAEVGVGWASTGSLFSRALIVDGAGNPTTITVLSDEVLDVEYSLRIYPSVVDVTGTRSIGGTTRSFVLRAAEIDDSQWAVGSLVRGAICSNTALNTCQLYPAASALGAVTGVPTGTGISSSSLSAATYVAGTYTRGLTVTWGLSVVPSGGARCALFRFGPSAASGSGGSMQMSLDPVLEKDGDNILTLNMAVSWGRL